MRFAAALALATVAACGAPVRQVAPACDRIDGTVIDLDDGDAPIPAPR